ncbi:hypothetical protein LOK49_LG10G02829 [Camellia lanceoleosa]|uniref:Uncharacterized protein n=1 Tax=Camellia lanceoleosa TaxID=1840588 RepID=A0ACC0G5T2_9ERIC|nr:hypothetical protein LOK49_LG10G02829 [Camellia lanceoleosa]
MTETVIFNFASRILEKIGLVALREVGPTWGLEEELKTLEGTMSTIKAVLSAAETIYDPEYYSIVKDVWYQKLQAAFYEADNVLDEFQYEALRCQVSNHNRSIGMQKLIMVETILFSLASKVVQKIGSIAIREVGLEWGVEEELKTLEGTLSTVKAVLLDAERLYNQAPQGYYSIVMGVWFERLQTAIYEADNLLNEFQYEALRRQVLLRMNDRGIGIQEASIKCRLQVFEVCGSPRSLGETQSIK